VCDRGSGGGTGPSVGPPVLQPEDAREGAHDLTPPPEFEPAPQRVAGESVSSHGDHQEERAFFIVTLLF
jgi:hypothetical protein